MTFEDNYSFRINQSNVRYTTRSKLGINSALSIRSMIMFNTVLVIFFNNFCLKSIDILIDTETNKTNFAFPGFLILLKHVDVMLHGSLARRTPSSPEIKQDNFTLFTYKSSLIRCLHLSIYKLERCDVGDFRNFVTNLELACDFYFTIDIPSGVFEFSFDSIFLCSLRQLHVSGYPESTLELIFSFREVTNHSSTECNS